MKAFPVKENFSYIFYEVGKGEVEAEGENEEGQRWMEEESIIKWQERKGEKSKGMRNSSNDSGKRR